ncbi:MAG: hypothetical protein WCK89_15885, partial [bacterium]
MLKGAASGHPEVHEIRRAIRHHAVFAEIRLAGAIVLGSFLVYLLSLPIAARATKGVFGRVVKHVYRPALWVYERPVAGVPLQRYVKLWLHDTELADRFRVTLLNEGNAPADTGVKPDELEPKQKDYTRQVSEIKAAQASFAQAWPVEYARELDLLMERRRTAGDFEGWAVIQAERKQFDDTRQITDQSNEVLSELKVLKGKYRQMLA